MRASFVVVAALLLANPCFSLTTGKRTQQPAQILPEGNSKSDAKVRNVQHPAFANAGKKPGVEIWRIESFEPVAYPQNDYGKFHTGDSYIVLHTQQKNGVSTYDIHFWLGLETSVDESGAAAALTVQLDDQLGGIPVQHREVQNQESALFKSYFKNGVQYVAGGVPSGFRHVETTVQKKLYQVKGKTNIRVKAVELSAASMNNGDCFILDAGSDIYVYQAPKSSRVERLRATSAANLFRDTDHNGRAKVHILEEFSTEEDMNKFFEVLGSGSAAKVPEESTGGDDEEFERKEENAVTLYKVSETGGKAKVEKITQKPITQEMLNTNDCFILDTGVSDVYYWNGKKATAAEKSEAQTKAQGIITSNHYPSWAKPTKVIENAEPAIFRLYFKTWRGVGELHPRLL